MSKASINRLLASYEAGGLWSYSTRLMSEAWLNHDENLCTEALNVFERFALKACAAVVTDKQQKLYELNKEIRGEWRLIHSILRLPREETTKIEPPLIDQHRNDFRSKIHPKLEDDKKVRAWDLGEMVDQGFPLAENRATFADPWYNRICVLIEEFGIPTSLLDTFVERRKDPYVSNGQLSEIIKQLDEKIKQTLTAESGSKRELSAKAGGRDGGKSEPPAGKEETVEDLVPERLTFDDETMTITLDGRSFRIEEPKAYRIVKLLQKRLGQTTTRANIRAEIHQMQGTNMVREMINTLPKKIQDCIGSNTRNGYWLVLPEKKRIR
jgi:hypothetical protein